MSKDTDSTKSKSLTKEYMDLHDKYVKQFGKDRTLVLMQVGKFYEAYGTDIRGPNLFKLESITDAAVARKGSNVSMAYPYMWGFPIQTASKYMPLLINSGYNLIVFDQVTPPPNVTRALMGIFSPATYIENLTRPNSSFIADIVVEEVIQKNGKPICIIGMSAIDVSTGDVYVHESYSDMMDDSLGLDEAIRFLNGLNPKEILIEKENLIKLDENHITEYLDLEGLYYQFRPFNQEHSKLVVQKLLFETVYPDAKGVANIFDTLGLTTSIYARKSLTTLVTYIGDHYDKLILGIKHPKFYLGTSNLTLGNDAINQLNIVDAGRESGSGKVHNLLDVINKAATHMGKRYIKMKLVAPMTDPVELNKIYDVVDFLIKRGFYLNLEENLRYISDIERLERKMEISMLSPCDFVNFARSFVRATALFSDIKSKNYLTKYIKTSHIRKKIAKMNTYIAEMFDLEKCKLYTHRADIKENIFKKGVFPDLDKKQADIGLSQDVMIELQNVLDNMIESKEAKEAKDTKSKEKTKITLKSNKVDGYYFHITKPRYEKLKTALDELEFIELQNHKIKTSELEYKEIKNAYKISAPFLKTKTDNIDELMEDIRSEVCEKYANTLRQIYKDYSVSIKESVKTVTEIDYYFCIARVSRLQNYNRPIITKDDKAESYIKATDLRHPIVEQIVEHEYIPHSIDIGRDLKGMMIYGLNSAGKSVLMKAIGIAVIMAQAGFFVPARSFEFYPYTALYTRITGNDNLFRGLSSFSLEMVELNAILKRADNRTLVIGDEVCRGTEHISGNAIVAASLLKLNSVGSTFVFATHLHELMGLEQIQNVPSIKAYHLSVEFDEKTDDLVYDRRLKPGTGERIYGIIVAKSIIRNAEFINKALEIKNILLDKDPELSMICNKRSKYNADLIVDKCMLCNLPNSHNKPTPLEVHHINSQADCENGFVKSKPHIKKNHRSNLIQICQKCHDDIHAGKIRIKGYAATLTGTRIIFEDGRPDLVLDANTDQNENTDAAEADNDNESGSDRSRSSDSESTTDRLRQLNRSAIKTKQIKAVNAAKPTKAVQPDKTVQTVQTVQSGKTVKSTKAVRSAKAVKSVNPNKN